MAVNIWALDKDQSIKFALLALSAQLQPQNFVIDLDIPLCAGAIYLHDPGNSAQRAYLYTHGQAHERYGIHLEYPEEMAGENLIDAYENLTLNSLVQILAVHFDIAF